jgi:ABC-type Mn2+/Zn2+ transport system permease subunit
MARCLRHTHALLTFAWLAMVPVALVTGWVGSLVFISACSIYANAAAHFAAWQGSRAEEAS